MTNSKKLTKKSILLCSMVIFFALVSLTVAGCKKELINDALDWKLIKIETADKTLTAENGDLPGNLTLSFRKDGSNDRISAFTGVNYYNAQASSKEFNFDFTNDMITMMSGDEKATELESLYLPVLMAGGEITFEKNGDFVDMVVTNEKGTLTYREFLLAGTNWDLVSYNDGTALVSLDEEAAGRVNLGFDEEGRAFGKAGINNFNAVYTRETGCWLSFSEAASTKMAGPEELMNLETKYLELLSKVNSYDISGSNLTLLDETGLTLLNFVEK